MFVLLCAGHWVRNRGAHAVGRCLCMLCVPERMCGYRAAFAKAATDFPLLKHQCVVLIFKGETDIRKCICCEKGNDSTTTEKCTIENRR